MNGSFGPAEFAFATIGDNDSPNAKAMVAKLPFINLAFVNRCEAVAKRRQIDPVLGAMATAADTRRRASANILKVVSRITSINEIIQCGRATASEPTQNKDQVAVGRLEWDRSVTEVRQVEAGIAHAVYSFFQRRHPVAAAIGVGHRSGTVSARPTS